MFMVLEVLLMLHSVMIYGRAWRSDQIYKIRNDDKNEGLYSPYQAGKGKALIIISNTLISILLSFGTDRDLVGCSFMFILVIRMQVKV